MGVRALHLARHFTDRGMRAAIVALVVAASTLLATPSHACVLSACPAPEVAAGTGSLEAAYVAQVDGRWVASNDAPPVHPYTYRLLTPCDAAVLAGEPCQDSDDRPCLAGPDQVLRELVLQQRRIVVPGLTEI